MKLFLINTSSDTYTYTYSVGTLSLSANSTTEISKLYWSSLYNDVNFIKDIRLNNVFVSDGDKTYYYPESEAYLEKIRNFVTEVVTQFEKDDKVLKLFSSSATVNSETSMATLLIKVPGTPGAEDGRFIAGGSCWFNAVTEGDKIIKVEVVDVDNLLGYGNDVVLRVWHDEDADEENQGWFFSTHRPVLAVEPIGGYGFIPSGFYLRIVGKKANNITEGTLYINLFWAKGE